MSTKRIARRRKILLARRLDTLASKMQEIIEISRDYGLSVPVVESDVVKMLDAAIDLRLS